MAAALKSACLVSEPQSSPAEFPALYKLQPGAAAAVEQGRAVPAVYYRGKHNTQLIYDSGIKQRAVYQPAARQHHTVYAEELL